ncbi:MAG: ATP-binding protein [Desulfobacterales bacterium]|nr:ATP-binding protein [Desulfobacterales bacterium]
MLIEFSVRNFRSVKEKQTLSLIADSGKSKLKNTFMPQDNTKLRLLKSTVIYGANASGKTNIIRAFHALRFLILESSEFGIGDDIPCYEPFAFDKSYINAPCWFNIIFLGTDNIKYSYEISFDKKEIISEVLDFYPKGYKAGLFARKKDGAHRPDLKKYFTNKSEVPKKILENRLFLSVAANNAHDQMIELYKYFKEKTVTWNQTDRLGRTELTKSISKILIEKNESKLKNKISRLIKIADTKIENISVTERDINDFSFTSDFPQEIKNEIITQNNYKIQAFHAIYEKGEKIGTGALDFNQESEGTNVLYALGGLIFVMFETGGVIFFDELDNSLHPKLCKFLIKLFHHSESNPNNAQLVFASHETTLLDRELFRKDQIWFTEKNKFGGTELFSVSDFEGVSDNIPFDQWYMKGKFGGQPNIKEIEFIFGDEKRKTKA